MKAIEILENFSKQIWERAKEFDLSSSRILTLSCFMIYDFMALVGGRDLEFCKAILFPLGRIFEDDHPFLKQIQLCLSEIIFAFEEGGEPS
jgi:hypothetical protein